MSIKVIGVKVKVTEAKNEIFIIVINNSDFV